MRLIDADSLKYRRKDYGGYDDVSDEERKRGILFLLKEDIASVPTIDPVKHGKWKQAWDDLRCCFVYECSSCGQPRSGVSEWNYCPTCGARMI